MVVTTAISVTELRIKWLTAFTSKGTSPSTRLSSTNLLALMSASIAPLQFLKASKNIIQSLLFDINKPFDLTKRYYFFLQTKNPVNSNNQQLNVKLTYTILSSDQKYTTICNIIVERIILFI